ncbi:MAG TPA: DUF4199 domain-containing protein [Bacteroidetes bacterium]|nr:DUF4199 domain-containing protein [Bacteroidota bacterium]
MNSQQTSIKYGIMAGTAIVLYLLLFYNLDRASIFNPLVFWGSLIFPMVGMVVATRKLREHQSGEISKKEAIQTSFLSWVVAMTFLHIFIYLLFNFIDNGLIDLQKEMFEASTDIKVKREDLEMTFGSLFFRWALMMIPGFLLSYTVASFLKNK